MKRTLILVILLLSYGCVMKKTMHSFPTEELIHVSETESKPKTFEGLAQVVAFQDDIISGAKPVGNAGFETLMKMDVNTIVCVDGVAPDVNTAKEYGINTIHIPLKYDSPSASQIFDLTTVVARGRDHGNVYIHCHQGKHRSATAAAIVSIALGSLTLEEAKSRMHVSQTSERYVGLWNAVENSSVIDEFDLLLNEKNYPSVVVAHGITRQMISIDEAMDNLLLIQQERWSTPVEHPDLIAVAEAGFISDTFRNIQLSKEASRFHADFETQLINAMHHASSLEEALLQQVSETKLDEYMNHVKQSCTNCHLGFRK